MKVNIYYGGRGLLDDPTSYVIDKNTFVSKGKNTPFHGREVKGRVMFTIIGGEVVYAYKERDTEK